MASRRSKSSTWRLVRWGLAIAVIVYLVGFRLVQEIGQDVSPDDRFIVVRVIDGDTIESKGGDKLRLLSIDTPEKGEPYYAEATSFVADLVLGKVARIEYSGARRDRYGRLLGYVYVDSVFVNKAILDNGLGYLYLFEDTDLDDPRIADLLGAQRRALAAKAGEWSLARTPEAFYLATPGRPPIPSAGLPQYPRPAGPATCGGTPPETRHCTKVFLLAATASRSRV